MIVECEGSAASMAGNPDQTANSLVIFRRGDVFDRKPINSAGWTAPKFMYEYAR